MKSKLKSKRKPAFVDLVRHKRSEEVIQVKNRIRRNSRLCSDRFFAHMFLDENGNACPEDHFFFLGSDRFTFWNARLLTARDAFWDKVASIACARSAALLSRGQIESLSQMEFTPVDRSPKGRVLAYRIVEREKPRFDQFGGLTFREQRLKLESEIVRCEPPAVHEYFKVDRRCGYGIGLEIVLDVKCIDRSVIEMAIDRFMQVGQVDWVSPEPVPRAHLPSISQYEAIA